jgi:hypothetical protein
MTREYTIQKNVVEDRLELPNTHPRVLIKSMSFLLEMGFIFIVSMETNVNAPIWLVDGILARNHKEKYHFLSYQPWCAPKMATWALRMSRKNT